MPTAIWKYPLEHPYTDLGELPIVGPESRVAASVRHVGLDGVGVPCIWVEVNPVEGVTSKPVTRRVQVRLVGTGHTMSDDERWSADHVGTFVDGDEVWHAFVTAR